MIIVVVMIYFKETTMTHLKADVPMGNRDCWSLRVGLCDRRQTCQSVIHVTDNFLQAWVFDIIETQNYWLTYPKHEHGMTKRYIWAKKYVYLLQIQKNGNYVNPQEEGRESKIVRQSIVQQRLQIPCGEANIIPKDYINSDLMSIINLLYKQIVNEIQASWLSLRENEGSQ